MGIRNKEEKGRGEVINEKGTNLSCPLCALSAFVVQNTFVVQKNAS